MSGISEERLASIDRCAKDFKSGTMLAGICGDVAGELIAEIRRLRAENAELRTSYERVDNHAAELSRQREKQADMIRTIDPLYR